MSPVLFVHCYDIYNRSGSFGMGWIRLICFGFCWIWHIIYKQGLIAEDGSGFFHDKWNPTWSFGFDCTPIPHTEPTQQYLQLFPTNIAKLHAHLFFLCRYEQCHVPLGFMKTHPGNMWGSQPLYWLLLHVAVLAEKRFCSKLFAMWNFYVHWCGFFLSFYLFCYEYDY